MFSEIEWFDCLVFSVWGLVFFWFGKTYGIMVERTLRYWWLRLKRLCQGRYITTPDDINIAR